MPRHLAKLAFPLTLVLVNSLIAAEPRVLIPSATAGGTTWRYTTDKPSDAWTRCDFDDRSWAEGQSGFGVTDFATPPAAVRTPWTTRAIWLRETIAAKRRPATKQP